MLMAKDSWGRTLVSHGILSTSPQVFEVSMAALRADVLDEEVRTNRATVDLFVLIPLLSSIHMYKGIVFNPTIHSIYLLVFILLSSSFHMWYLSR